MLLICKYHTKAHICEINEAYRWAAQRTRSAEASHHRDREHEGVARRRSRGEVRRAAPSYRNESQTANLIFGPRKKERKNRKTKGETTF